MPQIEWHDFVLSWRCSLYLCTLPKPDPEGFVCTQLCGSLGKQWVMFYGDMLSLQDGRTLHSSLEQQHLEKFKCWWGWGGELNIWLLLKKENLCWVFHILCLKNKVQCVTSKDLFEAEWWVNLFFQGVQGVWWVETQQRGNVWWEGSTWSAGSRVRGGGQGSGWSWRSFSQKVPSRAHKKMPSFHLGTRWAHVLCADAV